MQTVRVSDAVNDCAFILTFLSESFGRNPSPHQQALSYAAQTGLSLILDKLSIRLLDAGDALSHCELEMEV